MRPIREASVASSVVSDNSLAISDGGHDRAHHGHRSDEEALDSAPKFESAVFGALYTLQQQRLDTRAWVVVYRLAFDYLQLLLLVVQPAFGWRIHTNLWIWQVVNWAGHISTRLVNQGQSFYNVCFLIAAAAIFLALILLVWTAWVVKNPSFSKIRWPSTVLRIFLIMVVQTFYVSLLEVFFVSLDCRFFGTIPLGEVHGTLRSWPHSRCLSMPSMVYFALALVLSALLLCLSALTTISERERDLSCRRLLAAVHSTTELKALAVKTLLVVAASTLQTYDRVQATLLAAASLYLVWIYLRAAPHLNQWVNHVRVGLYASAAMPAVLLLPLAFSSLSDLMDTLNSVLWILVGVMLPVGFLASWAATAIRVWIVRKAVRDAEPGAKPALVYKFADASEVEFACRVLRRWSKEDIDVLEPEAVREGEEIVKLGLAQLGSDPAMLLLYSSFLIHVADSYQVGYAQTLVCKKQGPNFAQRFTIFVRELEHRASVTNRGLGGAMDLVGYLEFQRNLRVGIQAHKAALFAVREFWRMVLRSTVSFRHMARALIGIRNARTHADKVYRSILESYPQNAKVARFYARFLEEVQNDPWGAARYHRLSDRLEMESQEGQAGLLQFAGGGGKDGGGGVGAGMGDTARAVLIVNGTGVIQMASKVTCLLFGWKKGELEGKPFSSLVPPPYTLAGQMKSLDAIGLYASRGTAGAKKPSSTLEVAGVHRQRHMFPVKVTMTLVNGSGDDATLAMVIEAIPQEPGVVTMWVLPGGAIASVDAHFSDAFGSTPDEWVGRDVAAMAAEPAELQRLVEAATHAAAEVSAAAAIERTGSATSFATELQPAPSGCMFALRSIDSAMVGSEMERRRSVAGAVAAASGVRLLHKFCDPVAMDVSVNLGGAANSPVLVLTLRHAAPSGGLVMVLDHRGRMKYVTAALAALVGQSAAALVESRRTLDSLMPQPWAQLHAAQWQAKMDGNRGTLHDKEPPAFASRGGSVASVPPAALVVNLVTSSAALVPVVLEAAVREEGEAVSHVVTVTKSTLQAGLDQRRVALEVDKHGVVTSVGNSPPSLFGFDLALLVGRPLNEFIDVLRDVAPSSRPPPSSVTATAATAADSPHLHTPLGNAPGGPRGGKTKGQEAVAAFHGSGRRSSAMLVPPADDEATAVADCLTTGVSDLAELLLAYGSDAGRAAGAGGSGGGGGGAGAVADAAADAEFAALLDGGTSLTDWPTSRPLTMVQLVSLLADRSTHQPGMSWRVGVHAPMDAAQIQRMGAVAASILTKKTRPAVLQIDSVDSSVTGVQRLYLQLWRADWLSGVVEVDPRSEMVVRVTDPRLHPPGPLLGMPQQALQQVRVGLLLGERPEVLLSLDDGRRGGIKTDRSGGAVRIGRPRNVTARHLDGRDVRMTVQAVAKQGNSRNVFLVLRLVQPVLGQLDAFMYELLSSSATGRWWQMSHAAATEQQQQPPTSILQRQSSVTAAPVRTLTRSSSVLGIVNNVKFADVEPAAVPPAGVPSAIPPAGVPPAGIARTGSQRLTGAAARIAVQQPPPARLSIDNNHRGAFDDNGGGSDAGSSKRASLEGSDDDGAPARIKSQSSRRVSEWVQQQSANQANAGWDAAAAAAAATATRTQSPLPGHLPPGGTLLPPPALLPPPPKESSFLRMQLAVVREGGAGAGTAEKLGDGGRPAWFGRDDASQGASEVSVEQLITSEVLKKLKGHGDGGGGGGGGDADDAASEVSMDNASSRQSYEADANVDYTRGKRFRKIAKLVLTGKAQRAATRYRWHTAFAWLLLALGFAVCFVVLTILLNDQTLYLHNMTSTTFGPKYLVQMAIDARVMDTIQRGIPSPLYGPADLQPYVDKLAQAISDFQTAHHGVYLGFDGLRPLSSDFGLSNLWNKPTINAPMMIDTRPVVYTTVNMTLWQLGLQYVASGREIFNNYAKWGARNVSISDTRDFYFLNGSMVSLYYGYRTTMDATVNIALVNCEKLNGVQRWLMFIYGCAVCTLVLLYSCYLLHNVAEQRLHLFSVFLNVPQGFLRAQAIKEVKLEDDSDADSGSENGDVLLADGAKAGGGGGNGASFEEDEPFSTAQQPSVWRRFWAALVCFVCFWRPLLVAGGKRRLLRNGRDTYWLITPYIMWTCLAVVVYLVGYQLLFSMEEAIQMLNLIALARIRYRKAIHHAHEACLTPVFAEKRAQLALLANDLAINENRWIAMLYGAKAAGLEHEEMFWMVKKGLPFYGARETDMLYQPGQCLRTSGPCLPPDHEYYQVSHGGLDAMVQRLFVEMRYLTLDNLTDVNLNSTRLDYMWKVGLHDVVEAWATLTYDLLDNSLSYFHTVHTLNIAVLAVCCAASVLYVFVVMPAYLRLVTQEAKQVAELLSELPQDVAIHRVVQKELQLIETPVAADGPAVPVPERTPLSAAPSGDLNASDGPALRLSLRQRLLGSSSGARVSPA